MNRPEHDDVNFFTGIEVEHTPAYGMETLFVVGVQPINAIQVFLDNRNALLDESKHITHIYFGANQSFPNLKVNDGAEWAKWERMIYHCLDKGFWCTLDVDVQCVEGLAESGLCEHHRFIPMISAKLPYIDQLGYNAVLKLDDRDFDHSNFGVWCHRIHDLKSRTVFTEWDDYKDDEVW